MENFTAETQLLVELEERHDKVLQQLDELDKQIEAVLAQWTANREGPREAV